MPDKPDEEIRKSIKRFEESLPESERNPDAQRLALAAAGEKKARKRNPAEAAKKLKKRAESQPSVARCVGRRLWYKH